jgi:hypothetical protein
MRHETVINVSCLITKCIFSAAVAFRASFQNLQLKRTTAGRLTDCLEERQDQ